MKLAVDGGAFLKKAFEPAMNRRFIDNLPVRHLLLDSPRRFHRFSIGWSVLAVDEERKKIHIDRLYLPSI